MATLQSIFFKPARGYKKYIYGVGNTRTGVSPILYQLDGVINEQHSSSAKVTKHPIEFGADITDHVIKQPRKVVVNGIVTNSPFVKQFLNRLPGDPSIVENALGVLKGERARNAYKGLIALQNERLPVRLQTGLDVYDNMVLTNVSAPNDVENNLKVRLTFEEVFLIDGTATGAIQAVTSFPTDIDFATATTSLIGFGLAGSSFL